MTNTNDNNNQNQRPNPFSRTNNADNNNNNTSSRFGSSTTNNNNANTNNNASSRFGSSSSSRFGSNNNTNNTNTNNNASSRFGTPRPNRFGQQTIYWTVAPMTDAAIRISLDGLGDPFHRLLGMPLNIEYGKPEKVVEALQTDKKLLKKMCKVLDEAWESYKFEGAALLFPWDDDVRKAYSHPVYPSDNMPTNDNGGNNQNNDDDADDSLDWLESGNNQKSNVACLRAIDLAFVLNILARSRANVVVANTPLALEPGFLSQTVVCDDTRIVTLARATGCIDENW